MSRKPSFLNPFARIGRKTEGIPEFLVDDHVSPLEPGLSSRAPGLPPQPPSNHHVDMSIAPDTFSANFLDLHHTADYGTVKVMSSVAPDTVRVHPSRVFRNIGIQTEPEELVVGPRKGSLSKIKEVGKVWVPTHRLRHVLRLLKNRASPPSPHVPRGSPPPRPARPESLDLNFLELFDQFVQADGSLGVPNLERVSPVCPVPVARRRGVAFPKVEDVRAVPIHPEVHDVGPAQPPPRAKEPQVPPNSYLQKARNSSRRIGSDSRSRSPERWSVLQRNNLRVPSLRVAKWVTGGMLGTGGFAHVYLVYNVALKMECAMKVVHYARGLSEYTCRGLLNELKVLSILGSEPKPAPFLLQPSLQGELWAWLSSPGYLHILTDVCTGGDLSLYKRRLPFDGLYLVCAEMILGLSHLHRNAIVHHDLKPHNVLVNAAGHCMIADYGGARFLNRRGVLAREHDSIAIMTTAFAAPELLVNVEEGEIVEYDETVDYWSLGATMVSMIMEDEYLPGTRDTQFMEFRVERIRLKMTNDKMPTDLQRLVLDLLQMDSRKRPKYPGLVEHPAFRDIDWDEVLAQRMPVIPAVGEAIANAHGWTFDMPKVHKVNDLKVDFFEALQKESLPLGMDDSFNVEQQHAAMITDI